MQCESRGSGHPKSARNARCDKPERSRGGNKEVREYFLEHEVCKRTFGECQIANQHIGKQGEPATPSTTQRDRMRTKQLGYKCKLQGRKLSLRGACLHLDGEIHAFANIMILEDGWSRAMLGVDDGYQKISDQGRRHTQPKPVGFVFVLYFFLR